MKLKSYFAKDVKSALEKARRELGPEAMLVESRKAPPEAHRQGEYEVVMAAAAPEVASEAPAAKPSGAGGLEFSRLSTEVAEIRRQLERMAAAVNRSNVIQAARSLPQPELAEAFSALIEAEVDSGLAHEVLSRLRAAGASREALRRALETELASRFRCEAELGSPGREQRIVALVGPCGAGKTTTLVKLAVRYGLTARRPVQFLSTDACRIAGADQLRAYAAILGVGLQTLETPCALSQAIEEHRSKGLILIDTPGYSLKDLEDAADLARFLASRPEIDTHLVLTASMKSADLSRVVDRFEIFRPQKLLFTKLDETEAFGPILNEAARTAKPVSYLAAGQQIPEDLAPATTERILNLVLERGAERAAAAAA